MLAADQKKIVLNMDNVTYIDSAGLGTLVAAHTSAKSQKAGLTLSNLGSKFQEVLQVTKLLTVFDVYDSEAAAIGSFSKQSPAAFPSARAAMHAALHRPACLLPRLPLLW